MSYQQCERILDLEGTRFPLDAYTRPYYAQTVEVARLSIRMPSIRNAWRGRCSTDGSRQPEFAQLCKMPYNTSMPDSRNIQMTSQIATAATTI